jgi:hypothetical protein
VDWLVGKTARTRALCSATASARLSENSCISFLSCLTPPFCLTPPPASYACAYAFLRASLKPGWLACRHGGPSHFLQGHRGAKAGQTITPARQSSSLDRGRKEEGGKEQLARDRSEFIFYNSLDLAGGGGGERALKICLLHRHTTQLLHSAAAAASV